MRYFFVSELKIERRKFQWPEKSEKYDKVGGEVYPRVALVVYRGRVGL